MINIEFDNDNEVFTTQMPNTARNVVKANKADAKKLLRKEAASEILKKCGGLPKPGYSIELITNGQSNAGGFYEVIKGIWGKVDTLCIATWIINKDYIDMLFSDLENGKLDKLVFLISNRMSQLGKGHGPNFNVLKTKAMNHPRCEFRVANSHAKVYTMTNGIDYITVSGSGNWSENPRIENYTITNDKDRFLFHQSWMLEVAKSKQ
jgi:hypothetical protein